MIGPGSRIRTRCPIHPFASVLALTVVPVIVLSLVAAAAPPVRAQTEIPHGCTVMIAGPDESFEVIDLLLLTSLEPIDGQGRSRR